MQSFFMKKSFPILCRGEGGEGGGGEETLCFIFKSIPISKSSSVTFVVQLTPFKQNYLATVFKVIQFDFEIFQTVLAWTAKSCS